MTRLNNDELKTRDQAMFEDWKKMPLAEVAKRHGITPQAVHYRVKMIQAEKNEDLSELLRFRKLHPRNPHADNIARDVQILKDAKVFSRKAVAEKYGFTKQMIVYIQKKYGAFTPIDHTKRDLEILTLYKSTNLLQSEIAKRYGMTQTRISEILRKMWKKYPAMRRNIEERNRLLVEMFKTKTRKEVARHFNLSMGSISRINKNYKN